MEGLVRWRGRGNPSWQAGFQCHPPCRRPPQGHQALALPQRQYCAHWCAFSITAGMSAVALSAST